MTTAADIEEHVKQCAESIINVVVDRLRTHVLTMLEIDWHRFDESVLYERMRRDLAEACQAYDMPLAQSSLSHKATLTSDMVLVVQLRWPDRAHEVPAVLAPVGLSQPHYVHVSSFAVSQELHISRSAVLSSKLTQHRKEKVPAYSPDMSDELFAKRMKLLKKSLH